jgi:hypothetical protein
MEGQPFSAIRDHPNFSGVFSGHFENVSLLICHKISYEGKGRGKREEGRGKREEGRGKREEGRGKREEGRGKREERRKKREERGTKKKKHVPLLKPSTTASDTLTVISPRPLQVQYNLSPPSSPSSFPSPSSFFSHLALRCQSIQSEYARAKKGKGRACPWRYAEIVFVQSARSDIVCTGVSDPEKKIKKFQPQEERQN